MPALNSLVDQPYVVVAVVTGRIFCRLGKRWITGCWHAGGTGVVACHVSYQCGSVVVADFHTLRCRSGLAVSQAVQRSQSEGVDSCRYGRCDHWLGDGCSGVGCHGVNTDRIDGIWRSVLNTWFGRGHMDAPKAATVRRGCLLGYDFRLYQLCFPCWCAALSDLCAAPEITQNGVCGHYHHFVCCC